MKGLEVSRRFFHDWALPWLAANYPDTVPRVAAGVFAGSQVFGADDELSRDHGWGPEFRLILTEADYARCGRELEAAIRKAAPRRWADHELRYTEHGIDVQSIDGFFEHFTGFARPPENPRDWLVDRWGRQYSLYMVRHGHVHYDPLGEFSARRQEFHYYPHPVWLQCVRDRLFDAWHYGQYNYLDRLTRRRDPVAIAIAVGCFCESAMRLCLLLEKDYTPYWKWLAFEFRKHAVAGELDPLLRGLSETLDIETRAGFVRSACAILHRRLQEEGLANPKQGYHAHPLFCDLHHVDALIKEAGP